MLVYCRRARAAPFRSGGHAEEAGDEGALGRTKAHELERLLPWAWKAERLAAAADA